MSLSLCSMLLALTISSGPSESIRAEATLPNLAALPLAALQLPAAANSDPWRSGPAARRPVALPILYSSLGALQALDVYSTRRALNAGGREVNPLMASAAARSGTMLAVKAISTATSIYFTERAWRKNRKGAVVLMALINGVTAAVVARNLRNAR